MVSPSRLTDKLEFIGYVPDTGSNNYIAWYFGLKGGGNEPRLCLRLDRSENITSTHVSVKRVYPSRFGTEGRRYWFWVTPIDKHADLLFAMLPAEEVARATAFTLGVRYG